MPYENDDWVQGYLDGRCPDTPAPSDNRSAAYRHSFDVGRREITGRVLTANAYRMRAEKADAVERLARDGWHPSPHSATGPCAQCGGATNLIRPNMPVTCFYCGAIKKLDLNPAEIPKNINVFNVE